MEVRNPAAVRHLRLLYSQNDGEINIEFLAYCAVYNPILLLTFSVMNVFERWSFLDGCRTAMVLLALGVVASCEVSAEISRLLFDSEALDDEITVDVWTPSSYDPLRGEGYPVVYVHDGQNVFDPEQAFAGVAWELDDIADRLADNGEIEAPIIVAIHNRGARNLRANDYFPEMSLEYIATEDKPRTYIYETCRDGFFGDEYTAFVATELKPLVDSQYNTSSERTYTVGSSMGALASLYLFCEYPGIFKGAACLSTHWIGSFKLNSDYTLTDDPVCASAIFEYLDNNLPQPTGRKLYFDQGTEGWDADYLKYESSAREIATGDAYDCASGSLMTYDATGAGHNEWFWQQRADKPLKYLLGISSASADGAVCNPDSAELPLYDLQGRIVVGSPSPGLYIRNGKKVLIK